MKSAEEKGNCGRPSKWGKLNLMRPRLPVELVGEIDKIFDKFSNPVEASQYISRLLASKPQMQRLKLLDCKVSATPGVTAFASDNSYEEREVPLILLKNPHKSFLVQVTGDSMEDAGIHDDDVLLVEEIKPPFERLPDRAIVTAIVDDQMVVKRYRCLQDRYELLSENRRKSYPPISISADMSDHHSIHIFGIFQQVIPESLIDSIVQ